MLILIVLLFLLCWGPRLTLELMLKTSFLSEFQFTSFFYAIRVCLYMLPFVHSCLNPIVYCLMSSKFRSQLLQLLNRLLGQRASASYHSSREMTTRQPVHNRRFSSRQTIASEPNTSRYATNDTVA